MTGKNLFLLHGVVALCNTVTYAYEMHLLIAKRSLQHSYITSLL